MRLFSKGKRRSENTGPTLTDQLCIYLESRQRKLADLLNAKCAKVPKTSIKYGLIAFCLLVASYLLWLIISAF